MERAPSTPCPPCETIALRHGSIEAAWALSSERPVHLVAQSETASAGPMLMARMKAAPLLGRFDAAAQGPSPYYGVLLQHQGVQRLRGRRDESRLEAGNILIWNSRVSSAFDILSPLQETQLLIPADHFETHWPHLVPHGQDWRWLPGQTALSALARCGVDNLWQHRHLFDDSEMQRGTEALLDMLNQSLRQPRQMQRNKAEQYRDISRYIERELENPALTPLLIAHRHGCSVRALHALFAEFDATVAGSIRHLRLEKCREAVLTPHGHRIGQIALRWGFSDAAHFSKLFKATYGSSPRQFRDHYLSSSSLSRLTMEEAV